MKEVGGMEFAREFETTSGALPGVLKDQFGDTRDLVREIGLWFGKPDAERLPWLLDAIVEMHSAERGFLLHQDGQEEWECPLARDLDRENVRQPLAKVILPLAERALDSAQTWSCDDVPGLPDRDRWDRENLPRTKSLLVIPLSKNSVIYLDHRFQNLTTESTADLLLGVLAAAIQRVLDAATEKPHGVVSSKGKSAVTPVVQDQTLPHKVVEIIGEDPELIEAKKLIDKVAPSMAPILITGESGTGKELAARSVHDRSTRANGPFVSENCGAITETLLETELFGCVKGAYTGATSDRPGLFEMAHGGTIFLDEIGDTSPGWKKKLLRVIQEGVIRRVGGQDLINIDVRIVSATNRDLAEEVKAGRFREDLYYRLNVINVHLAPLRERGKDVILLAEHFLSGLNHESGTDYSITDEVVDSLLSQSWPGNIRQLQNEIRRIHALAGETLNTADFSDIGEDVGPRHAHELSASLDAVIAAGSIKSLIEQLEKEWIMKALEKFAGSRGDVCKSLGIPKTTLYAKMKRYGIGS